jgi:WhiB family redox-sensing transcriptional regulator
MTSGEAVDWRSKAACLEADPELFFPLTDQGPSRAQVNAAVALCLGCSVRETCLTWALDNDIHHGVWGGATEEQRHTILRGKQIHQDLERLSAIASAPAPRYRVSA